MNPSLQQGVKYIIGLLASVLLKVAEQALNEFCKEFFKELATVLPPLVKEGIKELVDWISGGSKRAVSPVADDLVDPANKETQQAAPLPTKLVETLLLSQLTSNINAFSEELSAGDVPFLSRKCDNDSLLFIVSPAA